jgi:type IV pilus assembly protein PilB
MQARERFDARGVCKAMKVGEILRNAGLVDEKQLEIALAEQSKTGSKLGAILAEHGFCSEEAVSRALAEQSGVDHVDLEERDLDDGALHCIPESLARRLQALPIAVEGTSLVVAMSNPTDIVAIDEIQRATELFVRVVSASHGQLMRALDRAYRGTLSSSATVEELIARAAQEGEGQMSDASAMVALIDELLAAAIRRGATDVHFEPDQRVLRVRFRVDGDLTQGPALKRSLLPSVVARIKVMSGLDISETRVPQDGKIAFHFQNRRVDLRVSTFPTIAGESIVIRILDKERQSLTLDALGLEAPLQERLNRLVRRPNGLVLAAGPTGSGKTTTLYALLRLVDASKRKVITLEDPVEYELPVATQCQVNEKAGLGFATGLRAILRHDPDVVLVGEMRDRETASLALRASLTGHLVFSTLHTNDAVRTVSRLIDMELDAYIVASCLVAVAAQRLVRRVCANCRYEYEPTPEELQAIGVREGTRGRFARGKGCDRCGGSGFRGREAIFELLEVSSEVSGLISRKAHADQIEEAALRAGMEPFRAVARRRALEGKMAVDEVQRVTAET